MILIGRSKKKLEILWQGLANFAEKENIPYELPTLYPINLQGADDQDYNDLAQTVGENYLHLDGIIHNAAILGNLSPMKLYPPQQWYKVIQTNLNAPFMLTQSCFSLLEKAQSARVIFTSTGVAKSAQPFWGCYAVSKAASDFLMQQFAIESKKNIAFCSFNPGVVATNMRAKAYPGEDPKSLLKVGDIMQYYSALLTTPTQTINGQCYDRKNFQ